MAETAVRTARARPRCSISSPARSGPTRGRSAWTARTSPASPITYARAGASTAPYQLVRAPPNLPIVVTVMAAVTHRRGERVRFWDTGYEAAGFLGEMNLLTKADRRFDL